MNTLPPDVFDTERGFPGEGMYKVTLSLVSNGWSGRYILLVGTSIFFFNFPTEYEIDEVIPDIVPTPTEYFGLKYIFLLIFESKCSVLKFISKTLEFKMTLSPLS